jgi:hypothetical protein
LQAGAQRRLDPHQAGLNLARKATQAAQERVWATHNDTLHLKGRRRRAAEREHRDAHHELAGAKRHEVALQTAAAPARDAVHLAATRVGELRQDIRSIEAFQRWNSPAQQAEQLRAIRDAIDDWNHWANGKPMPPARVDETLNRLRSEVVSDRPEYLALAEALDHWARPRGIVATPAQIGLPTPPSPSLGIEL